MEDMARRIAEPGRTEEGYRVSGLHPEGSDEPKRWKYNPKKLMSAEREALERRTGRNFTEFTIDVQKGNSLCRRALLFMYLKREHPGVKFDDVDFAWDELTLEHSKGELI
jgi:hypothetical protein